MGQMFGLLVECMGYVDRHRCLREPEEKTIWEAMAGEAVESSQPVGPMLAQGVTATADNVVARSAGKRGTHLEAGGKDQTINLIVVAANLHASLCQSIDALTLGVH